MIVSIAFRHGTDSRDLKSYVQQRCSNLESIAPELLRTQVVFSKQAQRDHIQDCATCHISVRAPRKRQFDLSEHNPSARFAFDRALEKLSNTLSRSQRVYTRRRLQDCI